MARRIHMGVRLSQHRAPPMKSPRLSGLPRWEPLRVPSRSKRKISGAQERSRRRAGSTAVAYFGLAGGDTEPVAISPLSIATAPHCLDSAFASNRPSAI
jgi:hypothetical protein